MSLSVVKSKVFVCFYVIVGHKRATRAVLLQTLNSLTLLRCSSHLIVISVCRKSIDICNVFGGRCFLLKQLRKWKRAMEVLYDPRILSSLITSSRRRGAKLLTLWKISLSCCESADLCLIPLRTWLSVLTVGMGWWNETGNVAPPDLTVTSSSVAVKHSHTRRGSWHWQKILLALRRVYGVPF